MLLTTETDGNSHILMDHDYLKREEEKEEEEEEELMLDDMDVGQYVEY